MRAVKIFKYVFTVIGLGMLIGVFYLYNDTRDFLKGALVTEGKVVELVRSRSSDSTTYRPVVEFKADDGSLIEFTSGAGSNPPSYSKGETVEVLYQQDSPEQAKINSFFSLWGAALILGGMGLIFFIVGFSMIVFGRLRNKEIEYLKKSGMPIKAKFQNVEINRSLRVNGRNPYQICAQWLNPDTNELHLFNSDNG